MHLLDIPKPHRPRRPRCASAAVMFGCCLIVAQMWNSTSAPIAACECMTCMPSFVAEPSPVRWVTVNTWQPYHHTFARVPHEMPLMELYDELCEIEDKAEVEWEKSSRYTAFVPTTQEEIDIYLRDEKKFMQKYSLTLEQVKMIKRDGYRIKHPKRNAISGDE